MKEKFYETVKKYMGAHGMAEPGDCIAAGVSGGADSVCMLHLLVRLQKDIPFRLAVVHVNHGMRAEAAEDAAFVKKLCAQWDIPFYLREVDMAGYAVSHRLSLEEAGRVLRYRAFQEVLLEISAGDRSRIAVAHNADDRAETMLFHMFRGSGLKGLSSIRPVRESVIRPLLCVDRGQIETYLAAAGLGWREDASNGEDAYARNKIRHHILPYAQQEICGRAVSHMGELADILAQTEDYLARETERLYDICVREDTERKPGGKSAVGTAGEIGNLYGEIKIELTKFCAEDVVMRKRILLRALERLTPYRKDITARHIAGLMELTQKEGSKELSLPYGIRAVKEYDTLFLRRKEETEGDLGRQQAQEADRPGRQSAAPSDDLPEICIAESSLTPGTAVEYEVPGTGSFTFILWEAAFLPGASFFYRKEQNIPENRYTKWFDYDKITTSLFLRTRRQGDYLTIDDALHTQSVKQYMINEKIPKTKRDDVYLLADGSHILWVPGHRVSRQYRVEKNTRRILEVRLRGGNDGGTNRGIADRGGSG
ncbi:MAG: tRNA lysidine(34) synthetase TilS [Lachnospiraceae bacterium]|nr:tRNA lysidine(34) synthetase TilS [Lachnospiraceae bacterium]